MATMRDERLRPTRASLLACFVVGTVSWASARADVQFEPSASVGVAYADNVTLAAEDPEHETIYEVLPGFDLNESGLRFTTAAKYRLEGYYYRDRRESDVFHQFDGKFSAALDRDNFFIDAGATRGQSIRDSRLPIPTSNLWVTPNRVDRDEYYVGPRFQYALGSNVRVNGSYRHSWIAYDHSVLQTDLFERDLSDDTTQLSFDNFQRERGFTWATRYYSVRTAYDRLRPWEYRQASVELGSWVGAGFRLFVSGGEESAWDDPFDPSLADGFWEAGFAKLAGRNFSAEIAAGERTYGASRRASLNYAFGRGKTTLTYVEQPTVQGRDPYDRLLLPATQDFLTNFGAVDRYIAKRLQWSLDFGLRRTELTLGVFSESREKRVRIDGVPLGDESQKAYTFSAKWRAGARSDVTVSAERDDWQFVDSSVMNLDWLRISADYRLGARTNVTAEFSRSSQGALRLSTNLVSIRLTRTFSTRHATSRDR